MALTIMHLRDIKQAASGQDVTIDVYMSDENGEHIISESVVELWDGNNMLYKGNGKHNGTWWTFTIPADVTIALHGRYYYAICNAEFAIHDITPIIII